MSERVSTDENFMICSYCGLTIDDGIIHLPTKIPKKCALMGKKFATAEQLEREHPVKMVASLKLGNLLREILQATYEEVNMHSPDADPFTKILNWNVCMINFMAQLNSKFLNIQASLANQGWSENQLKEAWKN